MRTLLLSLLPALLWCSPCQAQAVDEEGFLKDAAKKLGAFATRCFKARYPMRAREVWFEVLEHYDKDDASARESLGFLKVGTVWSPDPRFTYPTEDVPDAAVARLLAKHWDSVCDSLGAEHRALAEKLEASDAARAQYHWQRALRFLPKDVKAGKALGAKTFEGLSGTEQDLEILRRSRQIEREIARQLDAKYPVERLPDTARQGALDIGGASYIGVQTKRFRVWGDWDEAVLAEAAQNAERALAFCEEVFKGFKGYEWRSKGPVDYAFFKERDTWKKVCERNAKSFPPGRLQFVLQYTSATEIGTGKDRVRVAGVEEPPTVQDLAMRWTAQDFAGFSADALDEGIGHAVVGLFFGRNLVFLVGQQQDKESRTSTGQQRREAKMHIPDIAVWGELAVESAWQRTDVPAARLPTISAASFSDEARIKAWAFSDYLLRRDPNLLRMLDKARGASSSNESEIAALFAQETGLQLSGVDDDWRRFWTEDSPVLRAVRGDKTPLESVAKAAPDVLEEFNRARQLQQRGLVTWSADYSEACQQHAEYLKANKSERGGKENTQDPSKKGYSNAGRTFAPRALVVTDLKKPKDTIAQWIDWPGFRDALLDPQLEQVGLYVDGSILVMDVARGQGGTTLQSTTYPNNGQKDVPNEIALGELGADLEAAFQRAGKKKAKDVGYPMTAHFFRTNAMPKPASIRCVLRVDGKDEVPGLVHIGDGGSVRRTSAPGLVMFVPFEPLGHGLRFTVEWAWVDAQGNPSQTKASEFFTK